MGHTTCESRLAACHVAFVYPVGVAFVHSFVALVMKNMCAHACSTACALHAWMHRLPEIIFAL